MVYMSEEDQVPELDELLDLAYSNRADIDEIKAYVNEIREMCAFISQKNNIVYNKEPNEKISIHRNRQRKRNHLQRNPGSNKGD